MDVTGEENLTRTDYNVKRVFLSNGNTDGPRQAGFFVSMEPRGGPEPFWGARFHTLNILKPIGKDIQKILVDGADLEIKKKKNEHIMNVKIVASGTMKANWLESLDDECHRFMKLCFN